MKLYETTFIARQDISPAQVEALTEGLVNILKENGASTGKTEYCGLRNLAYPIRKNKRGHYVLMNVSASADALKELERRMRLNEDILRYLSVQVESHEEGPSALLKATKYGREDNERERRPRFEGERSKYMSDRPARPSAQDAPAADSQE